MVRSLSPVGLLPLLLLCAGVALGGERPAPQTDPDASTFTIHMPGYEPQKNDDYVCHTLAVPRHMFITAFWPTAHADRVHHMLLFGCETPLKPDDDGVWPCHSGCGMGASKMLYAWARNAAEFVMPDGVSFSIGSEEDGVKYLVLQVHYAQPFDGAVWDMGGVKMDVSMRPTANLAAIYLFYGQTAIPPQRDAYFMNMTCAYTGEAPIHPFAYRTHAHGLGRMNSAAYRRDNQWHMIGKRNPQWPQMFEKIKEDIRIVKGDQLAAVCRYDSMDRKKTTNIGMTGADEMCNFYMMYWRRAAEPDPFGGSGGGCAEMATSDRHKQAIFDTYPKEAFTLLPKNDELEAAAHQSGIKFGVLERGKWSKFGSTSLGQVSGIAIDPLSGHLLVFHRGKRSWEGNTFDASNRLRDRSPIAEDTVLEVDVGTGAKSVPKLLKSWGAKLFHLPHAIHADGRGGIWTTDVGSHQVIKWTVDAKNNYQSSISLGTKFEPGDDRTHFCKPAGVTSAPDGSVFVADGYCNARVVKFDSGGNYVEQFGTASPPGKTPAPLGTFSLPHDISMDTGGKRLYVADRQNGRVQVFAVDKGYKPLGEIRPSEEFDTVYAVDFSAPGQAVFFVPGEASTSKADSRLKAFAANPTTRQLLYAWTSVLDELKSPHSIKASPDGRYVYIAEITQPAGVVRKFEVMREKSDHIVASVHGNKHGGMDHMKKSDAEKPSSASSSSSAGTAPKLGHMPTVDGQGHNWIVVILVVLVAPLVIACLACACFRRRKRGNWRDDLRINRPLLNRTDRKGFKPLRTDDADGLDLSSDESEAEDTLYKAGMQKVKPPV